MDKNASAGGKIKSNEKEIASVCDIGFDVFRQLSIRLWAFNGWEKNITTFNFLCRDKVMLNTHFLCPSRSSLCAYYYILFYDFTFNEERKIKEREKNHIRNRKFHFFSSLLPALDSPPHPLPSSTPGPARETHSHLRSHRYLCAAAKAAKVYWGVSSWVRVHSLCI